MSELRLTRALPAETRERQPAASARLSRSRDRDAHLANESEDRHTGRPGALQPLARRAYGSESRRLGIVEPVFGHIAGHKRMDRSTLRGRTKVNTQWQLYCLVHNLEKVARYGAMNN